MRYCLRLETSGQKRAKSYSGVKCGRLRPRQREAGWKQGMKVSDEGGRRCVGRWLGTASFWAGQFTHLCIRHQAGVPGQVSIPTFMQPPRGFLPPLDVHFQFQVFCFFVLFLSLFHKHENTSDLSFHFPLDYLSKDSLRGGGRGDAVT